MNTVRVYIIDDHRLFVEGISTLLANENSFKLIGHSLSAKDFLKIIDEVNADVYLMDINMPEISGVELTRVLREKQPDAKIIALTMHDDFSYVKNMIKSGAHGYILKAANIQELIQAIKTVSVGEKYLGKDIKKILFDKIESLESLDAAIREEKELLTPREKEILALIAQDHSNAWIAEKLFISERTVETHRKNIISKTGVNSGIGLVRYAFEHNIISLEK